MVIGSILQLACLGALLVMLFIILKRPTPIDLALGVVCVTLPSEWFIEIKGLVVSFLYDMPFFIASFMFVWHIIHYKHYRNRQVFLLLVLFASYLLWSLCARFVHADGLGLQPIWAFYRNELIGLMFLLAGIVLAWRPTAVQHNMLALLIGSFAVEGAIGIVQTASGGQLLAGFNHYLGFLTPLPGNMQLPASLIELLLRLGGDNGIFVGSIFRAIGTHRQSNWFAVSMIGGLALCIGTVAGNPASRLRWWGFGAGSVMVVALFLSFTRTGYVAFVAMCVWYFLFWQSVRGRLQTFFMVALGMLLLVPVLVITMPIVVEGLDELVIARLEQIRQPFKSLAQESFRIRLWEIAFSRVAESPWFGTDAAIKLPEVLPYIAIDLDVPLHNQLVASIYSGGYVLGGIYLFTIIWLFWKSGHLKTRAKHIPLVTTWAIAANLCFVGFAVEGIGINWMAGASLPGIYWLVAGMSMMQYRVLYATSPTQVKSVAAPPGLPSSALVNGRVV